MTPGSPGNFNLIARPYGWMEYSPSAASSIVAARTISSPTSPPAAAPWSSATATAASLPRSSPSEPRPPRRRGRRRPHHARLLEPAPTPRTPPPQLASAPTTRTHSPSQPDRPLTSASPNSTSDCLSTAPTRSRTPLHPHRPPSRAERPLAHLGFPHSRGRHAVARAHPRPPALPRIPAPHRLAHHHLPDYTAALLSADFGCIAAHISLAGLLTTELWEYTPAMQLPPQRPKAADVNDPVPILEPASPSLPNQTLPSSTPTRIPLHVKHRKTPPIPRVSEIQHKPPTDVLRLTLKC